MDRLSIIIPALNESTRIVTCVKSCIAFAPSAEIIVVDGGSVDGTPVLAEKAGAKVMHSPPGRGRQCNAGAKVAKGSRLLFLHADSTLSEDAGKKLSSMFERRDFQIGTFRLRFDRQSRLLSLYAALTRFDSIWTSFGDQGIAVRHDFFEKIGRFPDWPLFDDVALLQTARRVTKVHSIKATVTTSARRFTKLGLMRTQLLNGWLILRYLLGASPESLARSYSAIMANPKNKSTHTLEFDRPTKETTVDMKSITYES